jgi:hypothetical protein
VEEWESRLFGGRLFGVWIPIESYTSTKRSYWFEYGVGCGHLSSSSSYRANSPGLRVYLESARVSPRIWQGKAVTPSSSSDAMLQDSWRFHIEQGLDIKSEFRKGKLNSMAGVVPLCHMR